MLAKKNRLPVQEALTRIGRTVRMPAFTIKIFAAQFPYSRFGVVVGRRVAQSAVGRNAIRRRAFSAIERIMTAWPIADYLVIVHPTAAAYTIDQWYGELIQSSLT